MTMIFYKDNRVDQKMELTHKELIENFIQDEIAYTNFLKGWPFERAFLNTMPGTPEPIQVSDENWKALWSEFKSQVPNPEYKA